MNIALLNQLREAAGGFIPLASLHAVAADLDESGDRARKLVGDWLEETLAEVSTQMR